MSAPCAGAKLAAVLALLLAPDAPGADGGSPIWTEPAVRWPAAALLDRCSWEPSDGEPLEFHLQLCLIWCLAHLWFQFAARRAALSHADMWCPRCQWPCRSLDPCPIVEPWTSAWLLPQKQVPRRQHRQRGVNEHSGTMGRALCSRQLWRRAAGRCTRGPAATRRALSCSGPT